MTSRTNVLPTAAVRAVAASRGRDATAATGESLNQVDAQELDRQAPTSISWTTTHHHGHTEDRDPEGPARAGDLRPGNICFWDGDGDMDHEDAMRSLRLMGEEIIPAVREMGKELDLQGRVRGRPGHQ